MDKTYLFPNFPHMLHGGDYNPDQWVNYPGVREEDMRLFRLANCNEMSLGIFAWAALEPEEGKFDFSFMDKAMDDIYAAGGRVLLATPSGARPHWLSHKYPEVQRWTEDFVQRRPGRRHNHCYTSPIYREKVQIINRKLAERYKDHPALIGWHISNEYNGRCYCPNCQKAFREFLREKYGTLDKLNDQWWNAFWSHTYTDWDQIEPPSMLGEFYTHGLTVDWKRFCSHQTIDFMKMEIAAVKEFTPHIPVTTNMMGFHEDPDYQEMARELDFTSIDVYPSWRGNTEADVPMAKKYALQFDLTRSLLHKPFLLMECTPSLVNWQPICKLKRPGAQMLASMQVIAHGADSVQYFQFRKSRGAMEKFHGAVVDHVGHEHTRAFREISEVGKRLQGMDALVGTNVDARVAMVFDWGNRWMLNNAQGFQLNDKKVMPTFEQFYSPLWDRGINTDVIGYDDDFSRYKVLIMPMPYAVSEAVGQKLRAFVEKGGILLSTYTTAMVNENDQCYLGGLPGAGLRPVFGIWNEEIDTLYPEEKNAVRCADGTLVDAVDYCELIHTEGARVLATYDSDFYAGMPAATVNGYGKGFAYYVAFRDTGDFTDRLVAQVLEKAGITSEFDGKLPYGVTAHSRADTGKTYVFLQNYTYEPQSVQTGITWTDVETGETVSGTMQLQPLQTRILVK